MKLYLVYYFEKPWDEYDSPLIDLKMICSTEEKAIQFISEQEVYDYCEWYWKEEIIDTLIDKYRGILNE